jgi:hypothetical protein
MFTSVHHLGILSLRVWFVTFVAPFVALSRLLVLGFSILPMWSQLLFFPPSLMIHLSSSTCHQAEDSSPSYMDDMIITCDDPKYITFVKAHLSDQFLMSDLGPLRYFLGIEISSMSKGFFLSQEKYIQDLLDRASLIGYWTAETPMDLNLHLTSTNGEPLEDPTCYRHIVGSLVYLDVTRLDISYSVHILTQLVSALTQIHYSNLLLVLRYLHGTISHRLFFSML